MFIVTSKHFTNFVVYSAVCGGNLVAVDYEQVFLTPTTRQDFLNKTICEWNIRTKSIDELVVLSLSVYDIEEENDFAVRTRSAHISKGSNLTTIMIQVSKCTLYYVSGNKHDRKF